MEGDGVVGLPHSTTLVGVCNPASPYFAPPCVHNTQPLANPIIKKFGMDWYVIPEGGLDKLKVINLPTHKLTEESLLMNGLTFCPTMKGHLFDLVKYIYLFARKFIFQVLHERKKSGTPLGPLGDWSSLMRWEYRTLRYLIDLWEEGHVDQEGDEFTELILNLALEICRERIDDQ